MPAPTARQRLIEAVAERFTNAVETPALAYPTAVLAVDAFYAENQDHPCYAVVVEEALRLMSEVIPAYVVNARAAFEQVQNAMQNMHRAMQNVNAAAQAVGPWVDLAQTLGKVEKNAVKYDASGLPATEHPDWTGGVDPNRGVPCIEEGCGNEVPPGETYCADCRPEPTENTAILRLRDSIEPDVAHEVSMEDTGRPAVHFRPYRRPEGVPEDAPVPMFNMSVEGTRFEVQTSQDGGASWQTLEGVSAIDVEMGSPPPSPEVIELGVREFHVAVARRLRQLGCTYQQLKAMHDRHDFETSQHHAAWFAFGDSVDVEQLDRAVWVLDHLTFGPDAPNLSEEEIERAERSYPTDRITGAPHHYIVNGDHSGCGCGGHDPSCTIHDVPHWRHAPTLCNVRRQLCIHHPRHTYSQPCSEYHENMADLVGRTDPEEDDRGPAAG
ncbi:hypothetical protein SEA_GALACTICA_59 [Streptomyces phage Galactica]|nr:hypothetical protein SEA_GALACTICA_59 [Streptomyces phage Galactica]